MLNIVVDIVVIFYCLLFLYCLQAAWLLRVASCIDLTTLAGDDTSANVQRLCFKAKQPIRQDLLAAMGLKDLGQCATAFSLRLVTVLQNTQLINAYPLRFIVMPSVLWRCWFGSRKGIRSVKNRVVGCWSEVQTCIWPSWCHCHSLSFASVKCTLVLPFWYRLTRVVPDKGPLNGCACYNIETLLTDVFLLSSLLCCFVLLEMLWGPRVFKIGHLNNEYDAHIEI